MAKGDGSITEVRRGVWRVCVSFGKNPITGKREKVQKIVHGSKAQARMERDRIRREHEQGLTADGSKKTFREFAKEWQTARERDGELSARTIKDGEFCTNRLSEHIGNFRLCEITPQVVESLYAVLRENKAHGGRPLSGTTMLKYHVTLKQIMQKAVDYDCILRNPCDRVKAPKKDTVKRRSLTTDNARRLLKALNESEEVAYAEFNAKEQRQFDRGNGFGRIEIHGIYELCDLIAVRIGLATGMRLGEVLGLSWGCVDFDTLTIRVSQKLDLYGNIGDPKSEAGKRIIAIDAETASHLARWKDYQAIQLRKLGIRQSESTFVCCSDKGLQTDEANFQRWWRKWREKNSKKGDGGANPEMAFLTDLKFHELRHTQATQLLANGVDIKTVQTRMGHSSASLTLDTYAHALPENDRAASDMIASLFSDEPDRPRIVEIESLKVA